MEPWKDSCCSRREASAEVGDQDRRHSTCEQIVCSKHCLSLKTFMPKFVAFIVSLGDLISCIRGMSFSVTLAILELISRPLFYCPPPGRWTMSISQR